MRFKRATAINVLTLVITLFGIDAQITAGSGVGGVLTFRAVHHNNHHVIILIRCNHCMLFRKSYTLYYIDLQSLLSHVVDTLVTTIHVHYYLKYGHKFIRFHPCITSHRTFPRSQLYARNEQCAVRWPKRTTKNTHRHGAWHIYTCNPYRAWHHLVACGIATTFSYVENCRDSLPSLVGYTAHSQWPEST